MKIKILLWLMLGIASYFLATMLILRFYPDNPAQMNWQDREAFNAKFIQRLNVATDVKQEFLISRLGSPDITEAYRHDGIVYQLLYYRTHRKAADGITTADECTALLFIDRQLKAVGEDAINRYLELQPDARSIE